MKFCKVLIILFLAIFLVMPAFAPTGVIANDKNFCQEEVRLAVPSGVIVQEDQAIKFVENELYILQSGIEKTNFVYDRVWVNFNYQFSIFYKSDFDNSFY